jgi:hypothetical protein
VTTLREALQAEGMLDRELQYYATDDQLTEAKERIAAQQKEIERLRDIELSRRTTIKELDEELQRERNTASAAWATADQLKDEIANLRKANSTFAGMGISPIALRPALIQATVLVLAYEAGHLWDETAKDFIVEHSGADWLAEAQTQFERNLGADDEPQGMQMDDDPKFNPFTEERKEVAQLTRKPRLQQLAERLVVVEMTKADTRAVQQLSHGLAALMDKMLKLESRVPDDMAQRVQSLEDGKGTARRFAAVGQRIDAVMDAHNGAIDRIKKLETSVAELSLSPVYGPLPSGMSGQPAR